MYVTVKDKKKIKRVATGTKPLFSRTLVPMSFLTNLGPYFNFLSAKILGQMSFSHQGF